MGDVVVALAFMGDMVVASQTAYGFLDVADYGVMRWTGLLTKQRFFDRTTNKMF